MDVRTFRKSWSNYIGPVVRGAISLAMAVWLILNFDEAAGNVYGFVFDGLKQHANWIVIAGIVITIYWVVRSVFRFLWLQTYKVEIGPNGVSASYGILPWNKWQRFWEPNQIYTCLYRSSGFLDWALRHGDLILQGAEGATQQFTFTRIAHIRSACDLVNQVRARPNMVHA